MSRRLLVAVAILAIVAGLGLMLYPLLTPNDKASSAPPVAGTPVAPATIDPGSLPVVGNRDQSALPRFKRVRQGGLFAAISIPRLWGTDVYPLVEGIRAQDLDRGVAHYPMTPMPGRRGNVAFAAHRWEGPFYDFERLRVGDRIIIVTDNQRTNLTYEVTTEPTIIDVDDVWVIDPVPGHKRDRMLTLTTCWPKNGSSHREYVRARLIERN